MSSWDAAQYLKFGAQRTQPSRDLAARIPLEQPRKIIDIGCGPGNSTEVLRQRFPQADILGVDSSPEMIRAAATGASGNAVSAVRCRHGTGDAGQGF